MLLLAFDAHASTPSYTLKSSDIRISPCVGSTLDEIATAFHRRTGRTLVVTDGTRSVPSQAALLLTNLSEGKNIVALYAEKQLAREITEAFRAIPEHERSSRGHEVIETTLRGQIERGEYLSKHLREGAVDLRIYDLSARERNVLRAEVRNAKVQLVDESQSRRPHFHLNFLSCLKDKKKSKARRPSK